VTGVSENYERSSLLMRRRTRIIIGCLTVALALAAAVNTATARRIEISEQRFLMLFTEVTFEAGGISIVCPVTVEGSFHSRTIAKVSGQLIGYVTEAIFQHPCRQNNFWALNGTEVIQGVRSPNTLPWHILYLNFGGVLPRISEIEVAIIGSKVRAEAAGVLCLYATTSTQWVEGQIRVEEGRVTRLRVNEEKGAPLFESQSGVLCPASYFQKGEGIIATQGVHRAIFVRLVQ
jgi:hypothetical protein